MVRFSTVLLVVTVSLAGGLAAPKPKERPVERLGPITAEQLRQSANNLKQIGLAVHNYHATNNAMPTNQLSNDKKPLLSWRVQLLPYLEHNALYRQFKLDEPWDSENNKKLIDQMPEQYVPVRGRAEKGMTFYQGFAGKNGWLKPRMNLALFLDGLSNTFMVVEAEKAVIWTKPDDLQFDGKSVPALGGMFDGRFHALHGDGSVRRFRKGVPADTLKLLIDPADGHVIPDDIGLDTDGEK